MGLSGTGFNSGDKVPGIVGYEVDVLYSEHPQPVSLNYTRIGDFLFFDAWDDVEWSEVSIYQTLSKAWVFAADTMSWSWALGKPGFSHAGIQKMTANILSKFTPAPALATPGTEACNTYMSNDAPVTWSSGSAYSTLTIPDQGKVIDANIVQLQGKYTKYFKELRIYLKNPSGTFINVLKKCKKKNLTKLNLSLNDSSSKAISSSKCIPNAGKTYRPYKKLATFIGNKANGTWRLNLKMRSNKNKPATLTNWGLKVCSIPNQ